MQRIRPTLVRRFPSVRLLAGTLLLAGIAAGTLLLTAGGMRAELAPQPSDRQVALVVSQLLKHDHLAREVQPLDGTVSQRCFDSYLRRLDPFKLYFYQSDVDRFRQNCDALADKFQRGDIAFAHEVFNTFLKRLDERTAVAERLLNLEHDFTVEEDRIVDRKTIEWTKTPDEMYERWRKRVKHELLDLKVTEKEKFDAKEARERLQRRYGSFSKRMHQTHSDDVLELYLSSLTESLDPHTSYMSPTSFENLLIDLGKQLEGIGAALQSEDGYTTIARIVPGGPAEKDGSLKPEDRIIGVGQGNDGEIVDVVDMRLSDVVRLIRGRQGTVVRLEVIPAGQTEKKVYSITRARIELIDSVARSQVFEEGRKADGAPYKIGVIDLPSFYMDMTGARNKVPEFRSTTRDARKLLDQFKREKVDAVVVDLRRNGGGSLVEAINFTGLFIDRGPVVMVKDAKKRVETYEDEEAGMAWSGPLVVLTSKFSASASEIFAGAIQDYRRGLIVGDYATHGKGTVQSLLNLGERLFGPVPNAPNLGALKITQQQFYRPSGESTQKRGVLADIELPSITTHMPVGEGDLDFAVEFDRVEPSGFKKTDTVNLSMLADLRTRSRGRVEKSEEFQKLQTRIARYLEQKDRKSVTLNEARFLAERAEFDADREEENALKEEQDPNRPVVKKDYYFNEVLSITVDYLELLAAK